MILFDGSLDSGEIQPVNPKVKINLEYSLEVLTLKFQFEHFGHSDAKLNSLGKDPGAGKDVP